MSHKLLFAKWPRYYTRNIDCCSIARSTTGDEAGGGGSNMELWVLMAIAFVMFLVLLVLVVLVVKRLYFSRGAKRRQEHKSLPSASPSNAASPSGVLQGSLVLRSCTSITYFLLLSLIYTNTLICILYTKGVQKVMTVLILSPSNFKIGKPNFTKILYR